MGTEILKSFSHLQSELEEAKTSLKGVDENIKRLIGRDPSELAARPGQKRAAPEEKGQRQFAKFSRNYDSSDFPKRRNNPSAVSVFKRLSDKVLDDTVDFPSKGLISKVIAAPKEVPSRQDVLDKQNKDEKFKARNRRMFGALLGTLQKFQQEESKLKQKEEKRTKIEKKIEQHEQQEKEDIKKERQELFLNRKKKQQEIKMIELKMLRMKEYAAWEHSQKPRVNFIVTKGKPHIHYLPRRMTDKTKELLEVSKKSIQEQIETRKQVVMEELNHIEERMKRNFEPKLKEPEPEEKSDNRHDRYRSDSDMDDDVPKERSNSPQEDVDMTEFNKSEVEASKLDNCTQEDVQMKEDLVKETSEDMQDNVSNGNTTIEQNNSQSMQSI